MTPDLNETVTFTGPPGIIFVSCGSNVCSSSSNWTGVARLIVSATQTGTFTIQAAFGGATQSVTFTVLPHTVQLNIISAPSGTVSVGLSTAVPFTVQLLQDGTIPITGQWVSLAGQAGSVGLGACSLGLACELLTDGNGMASTTVTPLRAGLINLSATYAPYTVATSFTAVGAGETMTILQQPTPTIFVGDTVYFGVQLLGPGGFAPVVGDLVLFDIASGSFGFSDSGTPSPSQMTDGNGDAFEVGVAVAAGPITVIASDGVASQTMNFIAIARPDVVQIVSAPASGTIAGIAASTPFAVQVFADDGVTPLASRSVTISVTSGAASFAGCGGAATCQIVTDAQGMISTSVTPLSAGMITLQATEGGVQQSVSFTAVPGAAPQLSVVSLNPATYIAAGATISLPLNAVALDNSSPAQSQGVQWTLAGGFAAAATNTVTNSSGITSETSILGPLAAGDHAIATACAWGSVCAEFDGFGVALSSEAITVVSGNAQSVSGGTPLAPVVIAVVDAAGHPVAAAAVSIYQTATAFDAACPATGRCAAAAILATQATVVQSGIDGTITVTPLVVPGTATQTELAFSVGTQGFATVVAVAQP